MGIDLSRDCITRNDGSKLCYDIQKQEFILFTKNKVSGDEISKSEMIELIKILTKER